MSAPTHWYVYTEQGKKGPITREQMEQLLTKGSLNARSYIWRKGLEGWTRLAQTGDFAVEGAAQKVTPKTPEQLFEQLVKQSWELHSRHKRATQIDEVLLGAVITSTLDGGFSLIDLVSDGTNHYLRFEALDSGNRLIFRLQHLTPNYVTAKVAGHEADVTIGFGQRVKEFKKIWNALKREFKGSFVQQPEPGIIIMDGDVLSQYVYAEVGLRWDINDYLLRQDSFEVNYPKLTSHIAAVAHTLRKYLESRIA